MVYSCHAVKFMILPKTEEIKAEKKEHIAQGYDATGDYVSGRPLVRILTEAWDFVPYLFDNLATVITEDYY